MDESNKTNQTKIPKTIKPKSSGLFDCSSTRNTEKQISSPIIGKEQKQRRLIRSPEVCDIPAASVVAAVSTTVTDVMGGSSGFLTPHNNSVLVDFNINPSIITTEVTSTTTTANNASPVLPNICEDQSSGGASGSFQLDRSSNSSKDGNTSSTTDFICISSTNDTEENEQDLSILSNFNIDSTSEITFSDSFSGSFGASGGGGRLSQTPIQAAPGAQYLSSESPIRYVDGDENSTMGSDLSTSVASAKLTSGNTSLSGESNTSGGGFGSSLDAPPPPLTRLQNFLFNKSNDSAKSFEGGSTSGSTGAPSTTPLSPKLVEHSVGSSTSSTTVTGGITTRLAAAQSSSACTTTSSYLTANDKSGYYYQMTSPNNPFLPEIIAKNYANDDYIGNDQLTTPIEIVTGSKSGGVSPTPSHEKLTTWGHDSPVTPSKGPSIHEGIITPTRKSKLFSLNSPHFEHNSNKKTLQTQKKISPQTSMKRSFNPFLRHSHDPPNSDLMAKREEFLKATMKICLVVSPPSSKLQLKSKSLTHLDVLDSMVACHQGSTAPPPPPTSQQQQQSEHSVDEPTHQIGYLVQGVTAPPPSTTPSPIVSGCVTPSGIFQAYYYTNSSQHLSQPLSHQHHSSISSSSTAANSCNKICCLGQQMNSGGQFAPTATATTNAPNYCGGGISCDRHSTSGAVAATLNAASIHPVGLTATNNSQLKTIQQQQTPLQFAAAAAGTIKKKSSFMNRKKPILTRSTVSSSEYFSVIFYTEIGNDVEELIPIIKGQTLSDALSSALKMRNLSFSQITVTDNPFPGLSESGSPPYTTSLDENTDIENLAGKILILTEKDCFHNNKKNGTLQKAASFGSRTRPPRLLSSASTEETTSESDQKVIPGKQLKQRWYGLFGIKNPQQVQLCELLNRYAKQGVPQKSSAVNFDHPDFDAALAYLDKMPKSWQDFVNCDDLTENDIKIQSAIWELVTTEVDYIHALQTVTDLFLACLEAVQTEHILTDIDQMKLFSNIHDICDANLKFWTLYLYPMVVQSIKTHCPLCIDFFQSGFLTFATTFCPYKKYCAEQSTCQFYCKDLNRNNLVFTAYLAWCESQKMCNRLRLADILVRPMQRLTKYSLLLTAIRRHICDENDCDVIDSMIHSVENFVYSVNTHLTTRQENERLKGIMARIDSYDVVDASNEQLEKFTKQYSQMFDLCAPMKGCSHTQGRHLFMEGDLKLKDNISKSDVHCFLLTDMLLICKTIAKKGQGTLKVIRQPYLTDRLVIKHKENALHCVYLNDFQVAVAAFILQCSEAKSWHDGITKAKHIYSRLKQGSNWDGYSFRATGGSSSGDNANMLGVKKSPLNSSIGSRVSSLNNSHSGSVDLNDSRNISVDFEKANSLSSDEGSIMSNQLQAKQPKTLLATSPHKQKAITSANTLVVQPLTNLGQSLPNLNIHPSQVSCSSNLYHTYSNNTLLVPGHSSSHSGTLLLSPCHRGISYPPPSPTRATLRRGLAFSSSIKNPPLVKTRNITSQNSINWHPNIPAPTAAIISPNQQLTSAALAALITTTTTTATIEDHTNNESHV